MSKKTRKKSSKPSAGKAIRAQSATSAKKATSKTSKSASKSAPKSSKNTKNRQSSNATAKASHKAPLKKLKSPDATKSAPRATPAKATAAKPAVAKPAVAKPVVGKTAVAKTAVAKTVVAKPAVDRPAVVNPPVKKPSGEKAGESAASAPPSAPTSGPLIEGSKAPAFSLPRDGGSTVSLRDYAGQKLVLFFYPRADTPGCTKEAIDFTRLAGAFADAQTVVLGVSADPVKAQEAFRNKHELSIPLVSDERHEMLETYGVWGEKSMYGRTFLGVLRTTVLIGKDGRIIRIWRHVKVDGHADEVLAAAQAN
jgi:thioredoxin-dependent peroxiredoxin